MAKTSFEIQMDFQKANLQADSLDQIEKDLRKLSDDNLEHVLSSIADAWKGDNAVAFIRKGTKVQEELGKRADAVRKISDTLRKIAKNTYDTEMENVKIGQTRTY